MRAKRVAVFLMGAGICVGLFGFLGGCPEGGDGSQTPDPPIPQVGDLGPITPATVGKFADCTPSGFSDVVCDSGLRCGMVQVGETGTTGTLSQCVPVVEKPLGLGEACAFDQQAAPPTGGAMRRYDRCAPGLGCVPTENQGLRCRKLCQLRTRGTCGKELCVLPTPVTGTGYCAASDGCQPVAPQAKCGVDDAGKQLTCYVLTDSKGGGTFCLRRQPYGDSSGGQNAPCERSANCQAGLACTTVSGRDSVCRPYCSLPDTPDGGTPPDLAMAPYCTPDMGTCHPIAGYDSVGRCY